MPITVYSDMVLPNSVIAGGGLRGKNVRQNSRVTTDNGMSSVNTIWSRTLREYEFGTVPMRIGQWKIIEQYHEITEGGVFGFLMEDPKDNRVDLGVMAAISGTEFQLRKRYLHAASTRFKDRAITRPRASTVVVTVAGSPLSPGSYTLDEETGRITIPGGADVASLGWTGMFYIPVHFLDDTLDWTLIAPGSTEQRLLSGPSVVLQEIRE